MTNDMQDHTVTDDVTLTDSDEKFVNCHLKLTPSADKQLVKIQGLLRKSNARLSKTAIINLLLENISAETIQKELAPIIGNEIQNKIAQVFLNSEMNNEDLKLLNKMKERNKI